MVLEIVVSLDDVPLVVAENPVDVLHPESRLRETIFPVSPRTDPSLDLLLLSP
jgi:hypothetical protein